MNTNFPNLKESDFEKLIIDILKQKRMIHLDNDYMTRNEREGIRACVLVNILEKQISKFNPELTKNQINKVLNKIEQNHNADILNSNFAGLQAIQKGIKINVNFPRKQTINVKIVDFENPEMNTFHFINQFQMATQEPTTRHRFPDIVVFLNGLPIVVMELKNQTTATDTALDKAKKQINTYQRELKPLFTYNIFNVISNFNATKFGVLNLNKDKEKYFYWRTPGLKTNQTSAIDLFNNVFELYNLLDLIKNFTFFNNKKIHKFIASYHQFYAANKAFEAVLKSFKSSNPKLKKAGIVWHTQGSGKTLTMVFLVKKIISAVPKTTVILVTDRNSLDRQMLSNFQQAENFLGQDVKIINNRAELQEILSNQKQNGIFTTTLQKFKFDTNNKQLSHRQDLLIITDEAHRSHRNIDITQKFKWHEKTIVDHESYAFNLRNAFPNATFIGFTGTPIENSDHATTDVFGTYCHKYLMDEARRDGFVVGITYENRIGQWNLKPDILKKLDHDYEIINQTIQKDSKLPNYALKSIETKTTKAYKFFSDPDRIKAVTKDFIQHYENRSNILKDKAMFVALDRKIAVKYYHEILKIRPNWENKIRLIITSSADDGPEMNKLINKFNHRISATEFKKPDSDFKIAIIVDKWLTGFDVPCLDVMYIDKIFRMHNLMQAIARVNRNFTDKNNPQVFKSKGLIVDYIGLASYLTTAIKKYTLDGSIDKKQILNWQTSREIALYLENKVEETLQIYGLSDFDVGKWTKKQDYQYCFGLIEDMQNKIYEMNENDLKAKHILNYINLAQIIKKSYATVVSFLKSEKQFNLLAKVELILLVKKRIISLEVGEILTKPKYQNMQKNLDQKIADLIDFKKIDQPIETQSIKLEHLVHYIKNFQPKKHIHLDTKKFNNLVKKFIFQYLPSDFMFCKKLSQKLEEKMYQINRGQINAQETITEIKDIILNQIQIDEGLKHLNEKERSFYKLLINYKINSKQSNQYIEKIAKEIYQKIAKDLDDDWINWHNTSQKRLDIRANIKILLQSYGYPTKIINKIIFSSMISNFEENMNIMEYAKNNHYSEDFFIFLKDSE